MDEKTIAAAKTIAADRGHIARVGVVTDIHTAPGQWPRTERLLERALQTFAEYRVDCVVDLGDRINETSPEADRELVRRIALLLRSPGLPVFHLYGNHDVVLLGKDEQDALLGKSGGYEAVRAAGARLLLLDSMETVSGGPISEQQVEWLEEQLAAATLPTVVCCHHPLDEPDLSGHTYFSLHPEEASVANAAAIRQVLERCPRVNAVLQGHLHRWSASVRRGIAYLTLPPLTVSEDAHRTEGGHAVVTLSDGRVRVDLFDAHGWRAEWEVSAAQLAR